jgi:zinc protease
MKGFAGFVILCVTACVATPQPKAPERMLRYHNEAHLLTASNGMKILVAPDANSNLVGVDVRIQTGSVEDPPGKSGLARLVQSLMFETQPEGFDKPALGAQLAQATLDYGAYTTWDYTHFRSLALKDSLEEILRLEMLRLGSTCDAIAPEILERAKEAQRSQIARQRSEQSTQLVSMLVKSIYPKGHPYRRDRRGDPDEIASITREDVCVFMSRYYTPDRMILVVTGNATTDQVTKLGIKHIQHVNARPKTARPAMPASRIQRNAFKARAAMDEPVVFMAFPRPPRFAAGELAASVALSYLASELREAATDKEFITGSGVAMIGGERAPVSVVWVKVDEAKNMDRATRVIYKAINKLSKDLGSGETVHDLETTRQARLLQILQHIEPLANRGDVFADHVQFEGTIELVESELRQLKGLDLPEIRKAVARMAHEYLVVKMTPEKSKGSKQHKHKALEFSGKLAGDSTSWQIPVDVEEARQPIDLPPRKSSFSLTRTFTLDNGMRVMLFPFAALPVVDIRLIFSSGSVHEPDGHAGLAEIAAKLLIPRIRTFADLFTFQYFARTGSRFVTTVDQDTTTFHIRGLAMYFDIMLRTVAQIVSGSYSKQQVKEVVEVSKKLVEKRSMRLGHRYQHALHEAVFAADHPYTRSAAPSKESLARIKHGKLTKFKNEHYRAVNATLVITGSFDPDQVEGHVRYWFGSWSGKGTDSAGVTLPSQRKKGAQFIGVGADTSASQVNVVIAFPIAPGVGQDHAARLVAARMIRSRMHRALDRLGVAYDLSVSANAGAAPGMFMIDADIPSERTGEALAAMRAGLDGLRAGEDFEAAFVVARRKVVQELLAELTDSESVADRLTFLSQNGLGVEFYDKLVEQVAGLSPQQLRPLMDGELAPERETVICLGGRADIESAFAEAGIRDFRFIH